ncbi:MAG: hypothetical protein HWE25_04555 [Alphaproteobacteria bacterium]|nr:hypothetical protein [Alphaproteobacteria bacterium]
MADELDVCEDETAPKGKRGTKSIGLGLAFGVILGVAMGNVAIGILLGLVFGAGASRVGTGKD